MKIINFVANIPASLIRSISRRLSGRRNLLAFMVIFAAVGTTALIYSNAAPLGTPFAANSIWNAPLPTSTPVDPTTPNFLNWIKQDLAAYAGNGDINVNSFSPPIYTVPSGVSTTSFKFNDCQGKGYTPTDMLSQLANVPMPNYIQASPGTDQELTIYQPSTDTVWEMWGAQKRADGWYACWGGRITNVSTSSGIFPSNYGVTAAGLAMLGGTIRVSELQSGVIDHAIGLALIRTGNRSTGSSSNDTSFSNSFVWPANRYDGWVNDVNAPVEGTRLRLDPNLDVDALRLTKTATAIAKAAQKYGIFIWDTSGVVGFRAENPVSFTSQGQPDPYPAIFGNTPTYQQLAGFPWDKLQVLPAGYGKTGTSSELPAAPTNTTTPPDTSPPAVGIISPANGAILSGAVIIQASASDNSGISKVEFYLNNVLVTSDITAPYCYSGDNGTSCNTFDTKTLSNNSYALTAKAYDKFNNISTSSPNSITINNFTAPAINAPFTNPIAIPGRVEAENYDKGGEGVAYHDTDPTNNGGAYRTEGVDIRVSVEGGHQIGWTAAGEWLEYTVQIAEAGTYDLQLRVSSPAAGATYHLEADGITIASGLSVPNTGNYDVFSTVIKTGVKLPAGQHILRLVSDSNSTFGNVGDLNWFELQKTAAPVTNPSTTDTTPPSVPGIPSAKLINGGRRVSLTWPVSTDNTSVAGYYIYRNGVKIYAADGNSFIDGATDRGVSYTYKISAFDSAYNTSSQSLGVTISPTK